MHCRKLLSVPIFLSVTLLGAYEGLATPYFANTGRAGANQIAAANGSQRIIYQEWHDSQRQRDIPVKLYMPQNASTPSPVVIFSHGLGGSREAAIYLGEYWSAHGYACIFVQHPGSDSAVWQGGIGQGRQAIMTRMKAAANGQNLVDRSKDIKFVLDELARRNQTDPELKGRLNLQEIALGGHSFGAGTTLAIAGQTFAGFSMKDNRIKAAIYLCPPVGAGKLSPQRVYGNIAIPGLLMTGTEDNSPIGNTTPEERRIPFDGISSPHQYLVNFVGADHAVFGGRAFRMPQGGDDKFHTMIEEVTTQFLNATLKGDESAWRWLDSNGINSYLGKTAFVEKK